MDWESSPGDLMSTDFLEHPERVQGIELMPILRLFMREKRVACESHLKKSNRRTSAVQNQRHFTRI